MAHLRYLGSLLLLLGPWCKGQNLVPNGSFEDVVTCPSGFGQIDLAQGWGVPFFTSPDLFNACASPGTTASVPQNACGYQSPFHGNGYAGVLTYVEEGWAPNSNARKEIMVVELTQPLTIGTPVFVSMWVAVAFDGNVINSRMRWNASGVGMRFTTSSSYSPFDGLPNNAVAYLDQLLDTTTWHAITGTFVPDSAYTHLMIGGFFDDSLIVTDLAFPQGDYGGAYMFVDAVCVSETGDCDWLNVVENSPGEELLAFPNPFREELSVVMHLPSDMVDIALYDSSLREVYRSQGRGSSTHRIPRGDLVPGPYMLIISSPTIGRRTLYVNAI